MLYTVVNYWVADYATGGSDYNLQTTLQGINIGEIIDLYEFQLNSAQHSATTVYRYCNSKNTKGQDITWTDAGTGQANVIQAIPLDVEGFEWSGRGSLPRPSISISNLLGTFTTIISLLPNGLEGCKVTRIRTLGKYLDAVNFPSGSNSDADPNSYFPKEIYFIDRKVIENRDVITYEMCSAFDLAGVKLPKRQILPDEFPGIGAFKY